MSWMLTIIILIVLRFSEATKKASCNGWTLTAPKEGDFSCNPAGVIISTPGTKCKLNCEAGYRPQQDVLTCTETGGWSPTNTPECQVDTTMTLVIILSIVGSIVVIFGLSLLFARTSKKCRGRRRKLDEDDPESGNKRIQDTSTYYGQVKKLQRKRRLLAERQRRMVEAKRRKDALSEREVRKLPTNSKVKNDSKRSVNLVDKTNQKNGCNSKLKRRDLKLTTKDCKKVKSRKSAKDRLRIAGSDAKKRMRRKKSTSSLKKISTSRKDSSNHRAAEDRAPKTKTFFNCWRRLFRQHSNRKSIPPLAQEPSKLSVKQESTDIKKNPCAKTLQTTRKRPPSLSTSSSSSSETISSSSTDSSCNEEKSGKKDTSAIINLSSKKPPPRPPAPKCSSRVAKHKAKISGDDVNQKAVSSGYSSEGDRLRKRTKENEGTKEGQYKKNKHKVSDPGLKDTSNKRIEIMSYGLTTEDKEDVNPYEHYPAAQSYRQYVNFENDYRRTTGDYHPQYTNVKMIPLHGVKKIGKKGDKTSSDAFKEEKVTQSASQGGMKYISISETESNDDQGNTKKMKRKQKKLEERYEDPSARDKQRRYVKENKPRVRRDKQSKRIGKTMKERKDEIADERIIVNGMDSCPPPCSNEKNCENTGK